MTDTSRIYIYTDSQLLKVDAIFEKPIFLEILPVNIYHFKDFIYILKIFIRKDYIDIITFLYALPNNLNIGSIIFNRV